MAVTYCVRCIHLSLFKRSKVGELLTLAAALTTGDPHNVLAWISACWLGHDDKALAKERLGLLASAAAEQDPLLGLAVRSELAYNVGELGDRARAFELFEAVASDRAEVLGSTHPLTTASVVRMLILIGSIVESGGSPPDFNVVDGPLRPVVLAATGDQERYARLPEQLRTIVDELRDSAARR